MKRKTRLAAWVLVLAVTVALAPLRGRAAQEAVYLTAANETILEMTSETMPFWSNGALYVSNAVFEGTDLGVTYVRNTSMGLAVLYTPRTDLRFDLAAGTTYDKQGNTYSVRAFERGGYVFFPLDMICRYFGLAWSVTETDIVPLLRVTSESAQLDDSGFIAAAADAGQLSSRYEAYQRRIREQQAGQAGGDAPVQASEAQKVFLIAASRDAESTLAALAALEEGQTLTLLLTVEQMENGDLLRALVAGGHKVALLAQGATADTVELELEQARALLWQAACCWLDLVWYEGEADVAALFQLLGCGWVTPELDRRDTPLDSAGRARTLLSAIGRYRTDLPVYLGTDGDCLEGLPGLLSGLAQAQYRVCAWRLAP